MIELESFLKIIVPIAFVVVIKFSINRFKNNKETTQNITNGNNNTQIGGSYKINTDKENDAV